jgi:hypothetical protein
MNGSNEEHEDQLELALDKLLMGGVLYWRQGDHTFMFIATREQSIHTGRRRFCVVCSTCERLIHEATTGPIERLNDHLRSSRRQG